MTELVTAALLAIPPACFWIAWELRGIRERVGGVQLALAGTGKTAAAALVRANMANRRLEALERAINAPGVIHFNQHRRKTDDKA